jgi:hypothetical protein
MSMLVTGHRNNGEEPEAWSGRFRPSSPVHPAVWKRGPGHPESVSVDAFLQLIQEIRGFRHLLR